MPTGTPDWYKGLEHIWLPYTQMKTMMPPLPVASTLGCRITLEDGRELIDGISSWWSACHGYNHPHILSAMEKQLRTMPHVMFGGLVHEPALKLASKLCDISPDGLNRVFFSDSGSTAVEVAIKMAIQYWKNKGAKDKSKIVCFRNGYHGDTLGAMSVSDPDDLHKAFKNILVKQYVLDIPSDEYAFSEFSELLAGVAPHVAGLIIEPLVQGAGGMKFHSADVLAEIRRICKANDILFITDEIATGFARTGYMFACEEAGISPDIMCVGKALTGGAIGLAATLATEEIFSAFLDDDWEKCFMHGPTYMANPLACSAALASLELFESEPRIAQATHIENILHEALEQCAGLPGVVDVRTKGAIGVVQLDKTRMDPQWFRKKFVEHGCWIRPFGDIVYLMPPLVITEQDLNTLTTAVVDVVGEWSGG